jgi:hypothetical protein
MISTRLYCWSLGLVEFGFAGREEGRETAADNCPHAGGRRGRSRRRGELI